MTLLDRCSQDGEHQPCAVTVSAHASPSERKLKGVELFALLIDRGETIIDGGFDTGNRRGDRGGFDADEESISALYARTRR